MSEYELGPDVKPGVRVRVKIKSDGGVTTGELVGTVERTDDSVSPLKLKGYGWVSGAAIESVEVLAAPRMPEPEAGSIFARPVGQAQPDLTPWVRVDRRSNLGGCRWMTWDEVLELDAEHDPEVIDPRPTAPAPDPRQSGLGVRAAKEARAVRALTAREVWSARASARQLADAVTLLSRDLAQVEGALAAAKQRDKDGADAVRSVALTVADTFQAQAKRLRACGADDSADIWESARAILMERAARL